MARNQYISEEQFNWLLEDVNIEYDDRKKKDLLDRATGDLEADLVAKFKVPLVSVTTSTYAGAPEFARNKVLNAMKEKLREIIGYDKNRNAMIAIDSTEKFLNVHTGAYKSQIKDLLNPMIVYGFVTLDQAQGNAQGPVQAIGLSRANNRTRTGRSDDDGFGGAY